MIRILRFLPWLLTALLFAALVHFAAVLILPHVATRDAYHRLLALKPGPGMAVLPATAPGGSLLPFRDPATVQGVCFFDLAAAPVRLKLRIEEGRLLTLSFRTREGRIFYSMTDRAALHDTIDIRLVTEGQLREIEAADDEEERGLAAELRLKAPTSRGMIVATALAARPGERNDAEARVRAIACGPEPLPGP